MRHFFIPVIIGTVAVFAFAGALRFATHLHKVGQYEKAFEVARGHQVQYAVFNDHNQNLYLGMKENGHDTEVVISPNGEVQR